MMNTILFLRKSNEMLRHLLQRRSIREVLVGQTDFFMSHSGADLMIIYVRHGVSDYTEFVFEKNAASLVPLIRRYNLHRKRHAVAAALSKALDGRAYKRIKTFYPLLKGIVTERSWRNLSEETGLKEAFLFPICLENGNRIGLVSYYFTQTPPASEPLELKELTEVLESTIGLLYDEGEASFYSRCVHLDDVMAKLTQKERRIVKRVLEGESYPSVAKKLGVSINTLKTHMKNIFAKYGVSSKLELQGKLMNK